MSKSKHACTINSNTAIIIIITLFFFKTVETIMAKVNMEVHRLHYNFCLEYIITLPCSLVACFKAGEARMKKMLGMSQKSCNIQNPTPFFLV